MGVRHRRIFGKGVNRSRRHPEHVRVYLISPAVALEEKSEIDPILTPYGLLQAKSTWEQLFREEAVLREKQKQNYEENKAIIRMQIFTSPLKRCIGTAMMSVAATFPESFSADHQFTPENLCFPLPSTSSSGNDCSDKKSVNVVVLNGLCDANENVQLHGGAAKVVSEGLLDCAAASIFYADSATYKGNIIDDVLVRIKDEVKNETLSKGRESNEMTVPGSKVQFWREDGESDFAPMSRQESIEKDLSDVVSSEKTQSGRSRVIASSPRFPERDSFMGAVNHAAHLTAKAEAPVCVIITDLDGMKLLVKSCGYKHEDALPDGTTIAKFIATVYFPTVGLLSDHDAFSINWSFYGNSTNDDSKDSDKDPIFAPVMSRFLSSSRCNSSRIQISLSLDLINREEAQPSVDHVTLGLLAPPLDSSLLGSASIPNNLSITYYNKKKRVLKEIEKDNGVDVIPLDILHGRHKIANFIQFLKEERGTACGTFESNDGTLRTFVIDPLKQPTFPCPPCSLYIVLYS